jgi:hypothetical protein
MGTDLDVVVEANVGRLVEDRLFSSGSLQLVPKDLVLLIASYCDWWYALPIDGDIGRNYRLFGLLAGVRGLGKRGYKVSGGRRGLPDLPSEEAREKADDGWCTWITLDEADPSTNDELRRQFFGAWPTFGGSTKLGRQPLSADWLELVDTAAQFHQKYRFPIRFVLVFNS